MAEGKDILLSVRRRWSVQGLIFCGILGAGMGLLPTGLSWYVGLLCGVICFVVLVLLLSWRVSLSDTARVLDKSLPELEESCGLLLKPKEELGALEGLQVERIGQRLREAKLPHPLRKRLIIGVCLLAVVILVRIVLGYDRSVVPAAVKKLSSPVGKASVVAGIQGVDVHITPPAYTGRVMRSQKDLNLQVEEASVVSWEILTNVRVKEMEMIFNDSGIVRLKVVNGDSTMWRSSLIAGQSGFYQLKLNGVLSDLYKMEVTRDEAPRISIKTPKAYTVVDIGESRKIPLAVNVQDDYGVSDAIVVATVATGSGEAVKFKEHVLSFGKAFTGRQAVYDLQQTLNLDTLDLHPGDELYYYCRAKDNHGQESRSDMYIISLPDTARLMSLEGLSTGLDVKPELFRSQRQIIIETEQLLKGKDTISVQVFHNKSNDLGIDQKLLRLRYGKFLGEEAEEGGTGESFSAAGSTPGDFGNAAKVRDAFTDKHDNAEDATFFEPAIKQQLKATLTEMWNAELRLRTFKPQEALPYEYKALRLLKDLQQKSRAYVAKTGVRVTPLDPNRRLTGKLDEILAPQRQSVFDKGITDEDKLRMALSVLDRGGFGFDRSEMPLLMEASRLLGKQAMTRPGEFLVGFQAMKNILKGSASSTDRRQAQQAIRRMLPAPQANPSLHRGIPDAGLSQLYFSNVNKQ